MSYRNLGKQALETVIKSEQNVRIIEKYIYTVSKQQDPDNLEHVYINNIYQTVGDIINYVPLKNIISNAKMGWLHPAFKTVQEKIYEQDSFLENPFEVVEGVLECKCGSKRVMSYSKQCRGADEPMTTFAQCCACKFSWTE
jgi:DNA-directed RNA polymerase subunit M/transcription elongation factor TFIIS